MKKNGYTLIEAVIVIIVLSIVSAVGGLILLQAFRATHTSKSIINATSLNNMALRRMTNEFRTAIAISAVASNSITFVNGDGATICYYRNTNNKRLFRGVGSCTNTALLAENVTALTFSYLDRNFQSTTTPSNVKCINIDQSVTVGQGISNARTTVCPRNIL